MGIFLTPLVKSEINWFYSSKARQRCISSFDSGWQPVKVLWIFHCLKNEAPLRRRRRPHPSRFVPVSFLSVSFFLRLFSDPLCLLSHCTHTPCASRVFVSSYLFLSLILILLLLHHYIFLHNGFSLTLTSSCSSMSMLMCLDASLTLVSITLQTHSHHLVDFRQKQVFVISNEYDYWLK